jgi:hypothetical protein
MSIMFLAPAVDFNGFFTHSTRLTLTGLDLSNNLLPHGALKISTLFQKADGRDRLNTSA